MGEIVELHKKVSLSDTLRQLADMVDTKEIEAESATLIIGDSVFCYDTNKTSDPYQLQKYIVWDCEYAIRAAIDSSIVD